jgi:two-component system, sensor histidine kinase PdtaS
LPAPKDRGPPGLGTGIIEALSKQLKATVTRVDAKPGTRVEVRHHLS